MEASLLVVDDELKYQCAFAYSDIKESNQLQI